MHVHDVRMTEGGQNGEFATERLVSLASLLSQLFQGKARPRAVSILDQPDSAGPALSQRFELSVAVRTVAALGHGSSIRP